MPHADPDVRAEYNRNRWRTHGHIYRASRTVAAPPISREQLLQEDILQAQELARLEARRKGFNRARKEFDLWLTAERRWLSKTRTTFILGGLDAGPD